MTTFRDLVSRHRTVGVIVVVVVVLLAFVLVSQAMRPGSSDACGTRPSPITVKPSAPRSTAQRPEPVSVQRLDAADRAALRRTIANLRSMPKTTPATSRAHRAIDGPAARQPDLYAAAFTRALLTQDYRTPRSDLLAWVQSQSAASTEATVVGLIPKELRPKLAVASVQEGFDGAGPVPARGVWDTLAGLHGHTSVLIQRVIEPVAWSAAVANGTITDPGVTAREVDAEVRLHTVDHGRPQQQRYSVAVTMNLEGPPARDTYGLVMVVNYKSVRVR